MKVSVCMISYNQSLYIAKAIESVLEQKTNFDYELVIGDDCSTDGTASIIQKYKNLYPDKIKILPRENNLGMINNFLSTLQVCNGEYVAICEGDDYWSNPLKLQKQVDFLDKNLDFAVCFSKVYEQTGNEIKLSSINPWNDEKTFTINDLALGNFIHTPSVIFRNGLFGAFPSWFHISPVGDYVLHLLNARSGLIKYFPEPLAVYRRLTGIWSTQSRIYQINKFINVINHLLKEDFDIITKDILKIQKQNLVNEYCLVLLKVNDFSYIQKMREEISDESIFLNNWMLSVYPEKIKNILDSKTYKIAIFLSKIKSRLF